MTETNELKRTILLDIDGCLLKHHGDLHAQIMTKPEVLPGVIEKLNEWEIKGYKIILTTGRREALRKITEDQLMSVGIFYDQLVMGLGRGERVVINDFKPDSKLATASAICIERNTGLKSLTI